MADDQRHQMRDAGRRCPCLGAHSPALPGTWQLTVQWVRQGGGAGQRSRGWGWEHGFCGAAAAAIVPGGIHQRHRRPDARRHGPGPALVRSMAWQTPAPRGCDKGCRCRPAATGPSSWSWPGGASLKLYRSRLGTPQKYEVK
jgi:hypothetical protein